MIERDKIIAEICQALGHEDVSAAQKILHDKYPFQFEEKKPRQYSEKKQLKIFIRDGFIDRYSGKRLVFTPVLRILSNILKDFPYHLHWKMSECHFAYWELAPTIDHIIPVTRGGINDESNCVCTSQLRNSAKMNWLLEELGWELKPPGNMSEWDGLIGWFVQYVASHKSYQGDDYIKKWYEMAQKEMEQTLSP